MNTSLKAISLLLAVGFTGSLFAEFAGASLPAVLDAENIFSAFIFALTILITVSEYTRDNQAVALATPCPASSLHLVRFQRDITPARLAA